MYRFRLFSGYNRERIFAGYRKTNLIEVENVVATTSLDALTTGMFVTSLLLILFIGSMISMSIMRFFQKKKVQGAVYLVVGLAALVSFIVMASGWSS